MITCEKCGATFTREQQPYCTNPLCLKFTIKEVEYPTTGGTLTHIVGFKYPFNGYPDHITLGLTATVKRAVISTAKLFINSFRHSPIKNAVNWLGEIYEAEYKNYQIEERKLSKSSREVLRVGLLTARKISDEQYRMRAEQVAWCITMFWEMDSAYRYRGQDIIPQINKYKLNINTRKEVMRLIEIGMKREQSGLESKWKVLKFLLNTMFMIPSVRKKIRGILMEINLDELKPDSSDLYFMSRYFDYNFQGLPYEVREAWKKQEDEDYVEPEIKAGEYANVDIRPNEFFYKLNKEEAEMMANKVKGRLLEAYKIKND